ncbi:MAG: outer membrane beta-barrel protein [Litorimonas sp.]
MVRRSFHGTRTGPVVASLVAVLFCPAMAAAQSGFEVSAYGGAQGALDSNVEISDDRVVPDLDVDVEWEGRSFDHPIYYGIRATYWTEGRWGFGLDLTHSKTYADPIPAPLTRLEFTDGLNVLTANAYYRFDRTDFGMTPYLGGGLGISIPYAEVDFPGSQTRGYQVGGLAGKLMGGVKQELGADWHLFGEVMITQSFNTVDLETGGELSSDVTTGALNFGLGYTF